MASNQTKRITTRVVDALQPGEIAWDSDTGGFGIRCQKRAKVYVLKYRAGGRQRWATIGKHGSPWTVEKARTEAKRLLGMVADKKDPAAERDAEKSTPSVATLIVTFLNEHAEAKRKDRTAAEYRRLLEKLVLPRIGRMRVNDVTRADVARLHHSLGETPYQANRVLAVLSKLFTWAELHGYQADGTNPCRHIEKYREEKRERFLSTEELAKLAEVLDAAETDNTINPYVIAAIRLAIFTGARIGEILYLKWENVDFERAMLLLPESKSGKKVVYLSPPALEVLTCIPRMDGNPFVICGDRPGAALVNIQKPWRRIRAKAGLSDVRIHDLRHSFASIAASGGLSLPMIGKLLGHTQSATTERYAHLAADPVRTANDAIGERIAAAMKGEGAEVVTLSRNSQ